MSILLPPPPSFSVTNSVFPSLLCLSLPLRFTAEQLVFVRHVTDQMSSDSGAKGLQKPWEYFCSELCILSKHQSRTRYALGPRHQKTSPWFIYNLRHLTMLLCCQISYWLQVGCCSCAMYNVLFMMKGKFFYIKFLFYKLKEKWRM